MYSYPHKTAYGPLEGIFLQDYFHYLTSSRQNILYFHIPFCETKCGYCNLFSIAGQNMELIDSYFDAMERQTEQILVCMEKYLQTEDVSSKCSTVKKRISFYELVIGGGTPLYVSTRHLQGLFNMAERLGFKNGNIIMETSPGQTTPEKLQFLKEQAVNRISMGVQSFIQSELDTLHRQHTAKQAMQAAEWIKSATFDCVNLDLIYGIPEQTEQTLAVSIDQALSYDVDEIFIYPLYIKPDTWLYHKGIKPDNNAAQLGRFARQYLKGKGYTACSMRRFIKGSYKQGSSCGFENTLSIGCGGRTYLGNLHACMPYHVKQGECLYELHQYMNTQDYTRITHGYLLSAQEQKHRYVLKNLFFIEGLDTEEYRQIFHHNFLLDYPIVSDWMDKGYAKLEQNKLKLTEEGILLSDYLGPELGGIF